MACHPALALVFLLPVVLRRASCFHGWPVWQRILFDTCGAALQAVQPVSNFRSPLPVAKLHTTGRTLPAHWHLSGYPCHVLQAVSPCASIPLLQRAQNRVAFWVCPQQKCRCHLL